MTILPAAEGYGREPKLNQSFEASFKVKLKRLFKLDAHVKVQVLLTI